MSIARADVCSNPVSDEDGTHNRKTADEGIKRLAAMADDSASRESHGRSFGFLGRSEGNKDEVN